MKRIGKLVVALAAASLLFINAPSAGAVTAGAVAGQVTVNPTVPVSGCIATNYTFGSTAIVGVQVTTAPAAAAGTVNVTASGGSSCEDSSGGSGTVASLSCSGGVGVSAPPLVVGGGFSCSLSGGFTRTGPLVIVTLNGSVNGNAVSITVVALFVPTNTGMATGGPVTALFAGAFASL